MQNHTKMHLMSAHRRVSNHRMGFTYFLLLLLLTAVFPLHGIDFSKIKKDKVSFIFVKHHYVQTYVTGSVLWSRDRLLVATCQHPHCQAVYLSSISQQSDLCVRRSHEVHLLLRPWRGLLDACGSDLQQTGYYQTQTLSARIHKLTLAIRIWRVLYFDDVPFNFCLSLTVGELWHVSV